MSISYFESKKWKNITREERYFCSELFGCINGKEVDFIKLLNEKCTRKNLFNDKCEWDSGYEVCFYRDLLKMKGKPNKIIKKKQNGKTVKKFKYSPKRTFDLALFSNECIIVIEAKVQQGFDQKQLGNIEKDRCKILEIIKKDIKVKIVSLISSEYKKNMHKNTSDTFDCNITWKQIAKKYKGKKEIFDRADGLYKN